MRGCSSYGGVPRTTLPESRAAGTGGGDAIH